MKYQRSFQVGLAFLALTVGAIGQTNQVAWTPLQQDLPRQALTAIPLGQKAQSDVLHISVAMPFGDSEGIRSFIDSVSNPASPNYRKFLSPEQVGSRFGLKAAEVKKVSDYLASQGMKIRLIGKNRLSILADSTVAQAQSAFNVSIRDFITKMPGQSASSICFSSTEAPSVPVAIRPYVQYVGGLENFVRPTMVGVQTPDQLRTLYSIAPLYGSGNQGQGRTVGISNWVTYGLFNIPLTYQHWNLPTPPGGVSSNVKVVSIDDSNGEVSGASQVECDLDIQIVLSTAPLCNLILYDNCYNSDLIGVLTKEADDNEADIISESYAWNGPTQLFVAAHALHQSMSAQGITYLCASGDWGSQGVVDLYYPDEDPEVLSIGGTSVNTDANGNRISEVVWSNAGGGGWCPNQDPFNLLPSYQKGTGVPTNIPYRLVPDIALNSDPNTGYQIYIGGGLQQGWGGTSCASPLAAGSLAVSEQAIIASGGLTADNLGHQRFGRIHDLIYSFNGDPSVFYDITSGTTGTLPDGSASNATTGWDTASGWGAMIFSGFVARVLNFPQETAVTFAPASLPGGTTSVGTVTFKSPLGANSATIMLTSDNACAKVPASVTVTKGASSASFTVTTSGVSTSTTATITATLAGSSQSAVITVTPASLKALAFSPTSVIGGNPSTGTVTLNGAAGPGGTTVALNSSGAGATTPESVTVSQGKSTATFSVATLGEATTVTSTITANLGSATQSAVLTITPASFASVNVNPTTVIGGGSPTGTVFLNGFAPPAGITVKLSSAKATVPASVIVLSGNSSATFQIGTKPVTTSTSATITAVSGPITQSASLTIQPASLQAFSVAPTTAVGGSKTAVIGTLTMTGPAPTAGCTISLTSSNTKLATVPASARILSGATTGTFTVTHKAVATPQVVSVTAKYGTVTQQVSITLQPATMMSLTVTPTSVKGSGTTVVSGVVTLTGPAPAGGLVVSLSSTNSAVASVPKSVTIPSGGTSVKFMVTHKKVTSSTPITIAAILGQAQETAVLTVTP